MKNLFSLFTIILAVILLSCSDSNNSNTTATNDSTANTPPQVVEASIATTIQRDTNPKRRNVVMDTSRPVREMNTKFPYDISMTNAKKEEFISDKILANNGKPTVVLFWLTTCYPCRIELNAIKKAYPEWKKEADFNLVAISTDFQKNYDNFIKRVDKEEWPWETYHDTNREFRKVIPGKLNGLPQSFVFDKNGEIVYHKRKYTSGDEIKLFEKVKELAAK